MAELQRLRDLGAVQYNGTDFRENGQNGLYQAAAKQFGSWAKALEAAGISHLHHARKHPNRWWYRREVARRAVLALSIRLGKPPAALTWKDFESGGLSGLLQSRGTLGALLGFAGIQVAQGVRAKSFSGHWDQRRNRIEAVLLVKKRTGKEFHELKRRDFLRCGVGGVLRRGRSILSVCREAGFDGQPWKLGRLPNKFFEVRRNRFRAVRWLAQRTGKSLGALTKEDFRKFGLSTLLTRTKPYGVASVLAEVGGLREYRAQHPSWDKADEVREALLRVCRITGKKDLRKMTCDDLHDHGLAGLYQKFRSMGALFRAVGVTPTGPSNPYKASAGWYKSTHGHRFKWKSDRDFDDVLVRLLSLGPGEHHHNVPYGPGRKFNADFVSKKHGVAFEFFGWHYMNGRRNPRRQAEYRAHVRTKMAMARKFRWTLVGVIPKSSHEWIIRSNVPLAQVFAKLGLSKKKAQSRLEDSGTRR